MTITDEDKFHEAYREVGLRHSVYPGLVRGGKMTPDESARRIAIMAAIAADYREKCAPGLPL